MAVLFKQKIKFKQPDDFEQTRVYQMGLQAGGAAIGDGATFEFGIPVYLWKIYNQSAQCYWDNDAILGERGYTQASPVRFPFINISLFNGASTYQVNNYGSGSSMRLDSLQTIDFFKPVRIRTISLYRLTAVAQVHIWFSFSTNV